LDVAVISAHRMPGKRALGIQVAAEFRQRGAQRRR
jgi:hypothetical protein